MTRQKRRELRVEGFVVGRKHARILMNLLNLKVKNKRRLQATTNSKHSLPDGLPVIPPAVAFSLRSV